MPETNPTNVVTLSGSPPEPQPRKRSRKRADPTNAERQKRHRTKRKALPAAPLPESNVTPPAPVTSPATPSTVAPARETPRTSWALVTLAYGFFLLGVGTNLWNARTGDAVDMALPAAMGVLAEGVVFFLPARAIALPAGRRALAFTLLLFVTAFALTNSLRMASIVATDQAQARADRQTAGVTVATAVLDAARTARDQACRAGQSKSAACRSRQDEVTRLEKAQTAATAKVAAAAKPESTDFAGLVAWLTAGTVQPGARDFDML